LIKLLKTEWKIVVLGGAATLLFYLIPYFNLQLSKTFIFSEYMHLDADRLTADMKRGMTFPLSSFLPYQYLKFAAIFWFFLLAILFARIYRKTWRLHRPIIGCILAVILILFIFPDLLLFGEKRGSSLSQGHIAKGSLSFGKRVNFRGENFSTYSFPLFLAGRTYAHEKVRSTILDAYKLCETSSPETKYILGEIGWPSGGVFLPHRTHQMGTSVDFMSPYLKYEKSFSSNHIFNLIRI